MKYFKIERNGDTLKIGFGEQAQNDVIVKEVSETLKGMKENGELSGGGLIKLNGPASLPVSITIAHKLIHIFSSIAVFDPKINKYVISVSHDPIYQVGDLID